MAHTAGKQGTGKSYRETPGDGRFRFINVFRILTKRTGSYIVNDACAYVRIMRGDTRGQNELFLGNIPL
jgi:hypothetical protein